VSFILRNMAGSFLHAISGGRFASTPVDHEMARWYRQLSLYSQSFALVGDWTVAFLGGDLKRKQRLSGRMADILSDLYLLSSVLKRYEDDGRIEEDRPVVNAIARDLIFSMEQSFAAVFANFPNVVLRNLMRVLVFPLGRHAKPASDRETYRLARSVLQPGAFRDRLTKGTYVSMDPKDVTGVLEDALIKITGAAEIETKFIRAIKKGVIERRLDRDAISDAVEKGVLTEAEAATLRLADQATDKVIKVDDFEPDELGSKQLRRERPSVEEAAE
jgi:acyl-CoA dehydrogenase